MFQTFISRHNSNFFSDKLVLTSVTPASSAPVLQTPKATSSTLYFDSLTVNAGNGGFLHCIQMDTSVNAANQVVSRSEERFSRNAETDLVCRLLLEKKNLISVTSVKSKRTPPRTRWTGARAAGRACFPVSCLKRAVI